VNIEIALGAETPAHRTAREVLAEQETIHVGLGDIAG
jgi:hypothetical protein